VRVDHGIGYTGPLARGGDDWTSHAAVPHLSAGSQRAQLLRCFAEAGEEGLTAYEAGVVAGLLHVGYWKRVSDLMNAGLIEKTGGSRLVGTGKWQMVLVITEAGESALRGVVVVT